MTMKDVTRTSKDGDQFWTISEMYIRGNNVKYLRIPDTVLDTVAEEKQAREAAVSSSFSLSRCLFALVRFLTGHFI